MYPCVWGVSVYLSTPYFHSKCRLPDSKIEEFLQSSYYEYYDNAQDYEEPFAFTRGFVPTKSDTNLSIKSDFEVSNHFYENFGNVKCPRQRPRPKSTSAAQERMSAPKPVKRRNVSYNPTYNGVEGIGGSPSNDFNIRPSISEPYLLKEGLLHNLPHMCTNTSGFVKSMNYENVFDVKHPSEVGSETEESKDTYIEMRSAVKGEECRDVYEDMYVTVNSREDMDSVAEEENDDYSHLRQQKGRPKVNQYYNVLSTSSLSGLLNSDRLTSRVTIPPRTAAVSS